MDKLQDPWIFAGSVTVLVALSTYVWSKASDPAGEAGKATCRAAAVALFSLLLLTWLAHGTGDGGALVEPFPAE